MGVVSLEQLIALNDEIVALARSGVPLEQGLTEAGRELPGKLGREAESIGVRLERGESVSRVLDSLDYPPVYRAVVEAGLRSGRLAVALEGLSTSLRRVAELRRSWLLALVYPAVVLAIGYCLLLLTVLNVTPVVLEAHRAFGYGDRLPSRILSAVMDSVWIWGPLVPLVVVALLGTWWYLSARHVGRRTLGGSSLIWSSRSLLRSGRLATFSEVLALLVAQDVPLDESLRLAGQASGDRPLGRAADELAERIGRGQPLSDLSDLPAGFPPLLATMLLGGGSQPRLVERLQRMARLYHDRAQRAAEWVASYGSLLLAAALGGLITISFAALVFAPWFYLLWRLAQPS